MNPFFIVRRLLRRVLQQYMALSADTRRFAGLMLLWVLTMLASIAVGPVQGAPRVRDGGTQLLVAEFEMAVFEAVARPKRAHRRGGAS